MNKSELIKEVALKGQLSFNEATNAVDAIMETIAETMAEFNLQMQQNSD